jgi:hypothetical protein
MDGRHRSRRSGRIPPSALGIYCRYGASYKTIQFNIARETMKVRLSRIARCTIACLFFVAATSAVAGPLVVKDSNGVILGTFVSGGAESVQLITPKGYVAAIRVYDYQVGTLGSVISFGGYHLSSDCTGPMYSDTAMTGRVESNATMVVYVPAGATGTTAHTGDAYSYEIGGVCQNSAFGQDTLLVPILPNDPNVTGIGNGPFAMPLRISWAEPIFANGFETAAVARVQWPAGTA